jgi:hypothetical protein
LPQTGPDKKIYKTIKENSKNKEVYIITLENLKYSSYILRQQYEEFATIFELPTFIDKAYYKSFIEYLINTRKIKEIYSTKDIQELNITSNITYKPSNTYYNLQILKYRIKFSLPGKVIRKLARSIK